MRAIAFWVILGYIVLEIIGLSLFVERFGLVLGVMEVFFSAGFGLWLLRKALAQMGMLALFGQKDIFSLLRSGMFSSIGAVLLIIPGIFSDIIGVVLVLWGLLPSHKTKQSPYDQNTQAQYQKDFGEYFANAHNPKTRQEDEIIDVEVIESTPSSVASQKQSRSNQ
ncbi:FxsA family protein [Helicobacter zhangjianzhongii]|uniref:FxsA family protein n=1 Tax=Helicobacter zhangjianzhongii TaxID=2974574 RepID=A0ACC6FSX6_9HELI|nr:MULTISPECIES: FxsA family protein [unclassified Helicobacter]MDL0080290.1 FxsA family protein [Helicobacter sp. CPD2-1]MDL0082350.1 FxsA family protein [Helicobacter sp. XJK30-2]